MNLPTKAVKGIVTKNDKILLLQRNPKTRGEDNWDLPGGLVEINEDEKETLRREIKEELGVEIKIKEKSEKWIFFRLKDNKNISVQNYICEIINENIKLSAEHIDYRWIKIKDIRNYPVKDESLYESLEKLNF